VLIGAHRARVHVQVRVDKILGDHGKR
jgi:hypothetical protein